MIHPNESLVFDGFCCSPEPRPGSQIQLVKTHGDYMAKAGNRS
jgi:hypothetical protein